MMTEDRLFHAEPTPTERAQRRAGNRAAQGALFDTPAPELWSCPACGGDRARCTCSSTGARALALDLERPAYPPEGGTPLTRTRDAYKAHNEALRANYDEHQALTHHEALTIAAERCVSLFDILTIERGESWKQMHTRTTTPGWAGGDNFGSSDANAIEVGRGRYGSPTVAVRWSELADVIRAGITPETIDDARAAAEAWRELNSEPHNFAKRDPQTIEARELHYERYRSITDRFRAVERAVIARGLETLAPAATLL